jgi:hypothetical protein
MAAAVFVFIDVTPDLQVGRTRRLQNLLSRKI